MGWEAVSDYYTSPPWMPPYIPPEPPKSTIYQDEEMIDPVEETKDSPL